LIGHSAGLLGSLSASNADRRRAVSASYYALFNAITLSAANRVGADVPEALRHALRRTFGHSELLKVCRMHLSKQTSSRIAMTTAEEQLRQICDGFISLIAAREDADYDLMKTVSRVEAVDMLEIALKCVRMWISVETAPEGAAFLTTLYLQGRRRG